MQSGTNRRVQIANEIAVLVGKQLEAMQDREMTGLKLIQDVAYAERRKRITALRKELAPPAIKRFQFL